MVLAEHLAGTEELFAAEMTYQARQLGMNRTVFKNASGLPDEEQVTTARDMATLAKALRRDFPKYYTYFSRRSFTWKKRRHLNHNNMLHSFDQTRRRFGGRQPLCGMGVTSRIAVMTKPADCSARTADSRPDPGP